ncbi:MAG: sigma-70 family RNA polymerase sigma factor [Gammaproteobacteria bacterium]|jgi:RNA polymerase sigma-70 factor (ECF subfamily)
MAPSDEVLISQTLALKDNDAFGELVRRHQSRVLLLQRRLCRDRALAEDLTQETFLRAWQKLHTYRGSGSFQGWLAKLGYNVFLQHRRRHRLQRLEAELDEASLETGSNRTPDETATADLDRLLGVLDGEDQTILVLTYAMGLTNVEVAEVLEMPTGTVKARIHRAKQRIQLHLDEGHEPTASEPTQPRRMRRTGFAGRLLGQLTGA